MPLCFCVSVFLCLCIYLTPHIATLRTARIATLADITYVVTDDDDGKCLHLFSNPIFTFSLKYHTPFSRSRKPYLSFSTEPFSRRVFR